MSRERKTVRDYLQRGGVVGRCFKSQTTNQYVYRVKSLYEEDLHIYLSAIRLDFKRLNPIRLVRNLSECLYDKKVTPEEIRRAKESALAKA
jgi:hypothetical protein